MPEKLTVSVKEMDALRSQFSHREKELLSELGKMHKAYCALWTMYTEIQDCITYANESSEPFNFSVDLEPVSDGPHPPPKTKRKVSAT